MAQADEAATIYDPSTVFFIDLTLSAEAEAKLEAEPGEYVKGTFSMTKSSDGTPAGEEASPFIASRPVEVRLKGSVGGSFRKLSEKPGLKLKFKAANAVLGLRKMTLNNMVQDPSMLHETLAYASFRAAGVPASRTGFAYVRLNGNDIGVYLDLENLDDIALARIFGTFDDETQHLYEGEQGDDVFPGGEVGFEVDEGPEDNIADLEALIVAVNEDLEEGETWSEKVAPNVDLAEMTKMWAVEKYIDHWDGYSGHTEPSQAGLRPNNYYLFSEPTGRFQMLPWGTDQAWIPTIDVETPGREVTFDGPGGILFNKCLEDEECFRSYWKALRDTTDAIAALDPHGLAENTADLLAPWQAMEISDGRPEYDAEEIKEDKYGVDTTLAFIAGRRAEAEAWLSDNEPPEEEGGEEESGGGSKESTAASVAPVTTGLPNPPAPGVIELRKLAVEHGVLVTRLVPSGPGSITQWATLQTPKGRRQACLVNKSVSSVDNLRCSLSRAARVRLKKHDLQLKVHVSFAPQNGGAAAFVSRPFTAHAGDQK